MKLVKNTVFEFLVAPAESYAILRFPKVESECPLAYGNDRRCLYPFEKREPEIFPNALHIADKARRIGEIIGDFLSGKSGGIQREQHFFSERARFVRFEDIRRGLAHFHELVEQSVVVFEYERIPFSFVHVLVFG